MKINFLIKIIIFIIIEYNKEILESLDIISLIDNSILYLIVLLINTIYVKTSLILVILYYLLNMSINKLNLFLLIYLIYLLYIILKKIKIKFKRDLFIERFNLLLKIMISYFFIIILVAIGFSKNVSLFIGISNLILLINIIIPYNKITKNFLIYLGFYIITHNLLLLFFLNDFEEMIKLHLLINLYFLIYYIVRHFYDKDKEEFDKLNTKNSNDKDKENN